MEQKEAKVVLTIDYGTKKIGVCISETMTGHSKALPVVENNKNIFDDFDKIIADWLPNLCLIGVPSKASDEFLKSIKKFITEFIIYKNLSNLQTIKHMMNLKKNS